MHPNSTSPNTSPGTPSSQLLSYHSTPSDVTSNHDVHSVFDVSSYGQAESGTQPTLSCGHLGTRPTNPKRDSFSIQGEFTVASHGWRYPKDESIRRGASEIAEEKKTVGELASTNGVGTRGFEVAGLRASRLVP